MFFKSLNWFSVKFFLTGWSYILGQKQEVLNLIVWVVLFRICHFVLDWNWSLSWFADILLALIIRRVAAGGVCTSTCRLDGKVVVITGANTGIGLETARDLAQRGAKVILACRDMKKAEKVADELRKETKREFELLQLDLSSLASVRSFAEELRMKELQLYCLINNAGVMFCPYQKTEDGFEMQMGVNHLGHFLLTRLLLPLLSHGHPARIVTVSSLGHNLGKIPVEDFYYNHGYDRVKAYGNSKLANILFTYQLSKELKGTNIQVFALHPGVVQSDLGRHLPLGLHYVYRYAMQLLMKTTMEGAQTSVYCATEAEQHPLCYYSDCVANQPSPEAVDDEAALKLWQLSEELVGLKK